MADHVLESGKEAGMPAGPLRISVHSSTGKGTALLSSTSIAGVPTPNTIVRPDVLVIPAVDDRTIIRVKPARAGDVFPPGTTIDLTIEPATPSDDAGRILFHVDVPGLAERELVMLERRDERLTVSPYVFVNGPHLDGLAGQSWLVAREILGSETVDATSSINIVVAIDGSASMLAPTRDGSVAALVEVLAGMSLVVSPGRSLSAVFVGDTVTRVETESAATLGADVARVGTNRSLSIGFRSADPGLLGHSPDQNTVTYVLTDALPADLPELQNADHVEGEARHLVIFSDASALRSQGDAGVDVTVVEPVDSEEGVAGRLEFDKAALRRLLKSLLSGCFVPGTEFAKRVAA